ncbi:hypothetical protein Ac2012v2_005972 [Leucoagaricus gongylophorus]
MKFLVPFLTCLTAAYAQSITIYSPSVGDTLAPGQTTIVQIATPDFLSSSKEVSVAIGINPCSPSSCLSPSDILGHLLYSGSYNPQWHSDKSALQPFQNFSVTIPTVIPKGQASIGVAHFALVGAGLAPWLETKNVTVVIH